MSSHDEEEILKLSSQREGAIRLEGFSTSRDLKGGILLVGYVHQEWGAQVLRVHWSLFSSSTCKTQIQHCGNGTEFQSLLTV